MKGSASLRVSQDGGTGDAHGLTILTLFPSTLIYPIPLGIETRMRNTGRAVGLFKTEAVLVGAGPLAASEPQSVLPGAEQAFVITGQLHRPTRIETLPIDVNLLRSTGTGWVTDAQTRINITYKPPVPAVEISPGIMTKGAGFEWKVTHFQPNEVVRMRLTPLNLLNAAATYMLVADSQGNGVQNAAVYTTLGLGSYDAVAIGDSSGKRSEPIRVEVVNPPGPNPTGDMVVTMSKPKYYGWDDVIAYIYVGQYYRPGTTGTVRLSYASTGQFIKEGTFETGQNNVNFIYTTRLGNLPAGSHNSEVLIRLSAAYGGRTVSTAFKWQKY